jgi:hypothetical protein
LGKTFAARLFRYKGKAAWYFAIRGTKGDGDAVRVQLRRIPED